MLGKIARHLVMHIVIEQVIRIIFFGGVVLAFIKVLQQFRLP